MFGVHQVERGRIGGAGVRGEVPGVDAPRPVVQLRRGDGQVRRQNNHPPHEESAESQGPDCRAR